MTYHVTECSQKEVLAQQVFWRGWKYRKPNPSEQTSLFGQGAAKTASALYGVSIMYIRIGYDSINKLFASRQRSNFGNF